MVPHGHDEHRMLRQVHIRQDDRRVCEGYLEAEKGRSDSGRGIRRENNKRQKRTPAAERSAGDFLCSMLFIAEKD